MIPVSARFAAAVAQGHKIVTRADLYSGASQIAGSLAVQTGSLTVDSTASIRRSATLEILDPTGSLGDLATTAPLAPLGNELYLYRGIDYQDGSSEVYPIGVLGIVGSEQLDVVDQIYRVDAQDRAEKVAAARLVRPFAVTAGAFYAAEIQRLIDSRVPGLTYSAGFSNPGPVAPAGIVYAVEDDPWARANEMASAIGSDLYFDPAGVVTLVPTPDLSTAPPVWVYQAGTTCIVERLSRRFQRAEAYSHAVVLGEPLDGTTPVLAEAFDNDPASPTYYLGGFGDRPVFLRSPLITSQGTQAQDAADSLLRTKLGVLEQVSFSAVPMPTHEGGDVVQISFPTLGVNFPYVIDRFSMDLGPAGSLEATTRSKRTGS